MIRTLEDAQAHNQAMTEMLEDAKIESAILEDAEKIANAKWYPMFPKDEGHNDKCHRDGMRHYARKNVGGGLDIMGCQDDSTVKEAWTMKVDPATVPVLKSAYRCGDIPTSAKNEVRLNNIWTWREKNERVGTI